MITRYNYWELYLILVDVFFFFFFQAEDGIRDIGVTGVQTCALPIYPLEPADGLLERCRLKRPSHADFVDQQPQRACPGVVDAEVVKRRDQVEVGLDRKSVV